MRGAQIMKAGSLRLAVQTAVLAILIPAEVQAGELKDKIEYCVNCHGAQAQGFHGYYTAPRIAGQTVQYLEKQFKAIAEHKRDNPTSNLFMVPVVASIEPGMWPAIAKHFSALDPRPVGDGPRNLVSTGKRIYEEGVPDENVPACAACHGPDARGSDLVPRLAGQVYSYTVAQLAGWGKGYRKKDPANPGEPNPMQAIATSMTKEQMSAVAAYLSYQR